MISFGKCALAAVDALRTRHNRLINRDPLSALPQKFPQEAEAQNHRN
jgi:hypothetical protein